MIVVTCPLQTLGKYLYRYHNEILRIPTYIPTKNSPAIPFNISTTTKETYNVENSLLSLFPRFVNKHVMGNKISCNYDDIDNVSSEMLLYRALI